MKGACRVVAALACLSWPGLPPARAFDESSATIRDWLYHSRAGWAYVGRGDYKNAELRFHEAVKVATPDSKDDARLLARTYTDLALVLYYQKRYADAEPLARWALDVREKYKGMPRPAVFRSLYVLALIEDAREKYAEAEKDFERAAGMQESALGEGDPRVVPTYDNLAGVYREERRFDKAETLYKRAITIRQSTRGGDGPDLADLQEHYAALLRKMDRASEALVMDEQARSFREKGTPRSPRMPGPTEGFQPPANP